MTTTPYRVRIGDVWTSIAADTSGTFTADDPAGQLVAADLATAHAHGHHVPATPVGPWLPLTDPLAVRLWLLAHTDEVTGPTPRIPTDDDVPDDATVIH